MTLLINLVNIGVVLVNYLPEHDMVPGLFWIWPFIIVRVRFF